MKYTHYKTFDFVKDEYFKSWVFSPNEDSDFFWKSFIENHPHKMEMVMEAKALLLSIQFTGENPSSPSAEDRNAIYEKILRNSPVEANSKGRSFLSSAWQHSGILLRMTAILSLAVLASYILYLLGPGSASEKAAPVAQNIIAKSAPYGQKLTIQLSDSSIVKLNSGSSISFPDHFGAKREVSLEGEAYFEVSRDTEKPFIVKTGSLRTTVLGTSFNIKHYAEDTDIEVAVLSGKVAVSNFSPEMDLLDHVILNPLEMVSFHEKEKAMTRQTFAYDQVFAWKDNRIYFKNAGIDEILKTLERWYGVQFDVQKTISKEKDFTGEYDNKTLRTILEGISYTYQFNFKMDEKNVTIY